MSEVEAVSANNALGEENNQAEKTPKAKKSKSPRVSTIERTKEEGDAITKGIGGEVEGRRVTRSASKGVTATPPPPAKKERKTPAKGRGRPKKGTQNATDESDSHDECKDVNMAESESQGKNDETKKDSSQPVENNAHEEKEEIANNNAETAKEAEATQNGAKEDSVDASTSGEEKKEEKSDTAAEDAARPAAEAPEQPAE